MPAVQSVGANAGYIPNLIDSGNMQIEFSRNPDAFPLNKYIQTRPTKKQRGRYLRIDEANHSRIVGRNLEQYRWADTMDRPVRNDGGDQFSLEDYVTFRNNFGDRIGDLAAEQADWDIPAIAMRSQSQIAMTARTELVHRGLADPANWPSGHVIDVGLAAGLGLWSGALSTDPRIKKTLSRAVRLIMLKTNSKVRRSDLNLVINPTMANIMSETQEIINLIAQSPAAMGMLRNDSTAWTEWLLPEYIYGIRVVVEDTVINTAPRGAATQTPLFLMADAIGYLMSRPGQLESPGDGPSYSTVTLMVKEDMTVEKKTDPDHRRTSVNVVDDVGFANTAPISGVRLENLA